MKMAAGMVAVGTMVFMSPTTAMAASTGWVTGGSCGPDSTNVISSSTGSFGTVRHDWQYAGGSSYVSWPAGGYHANDTTKRSINYYAVQSFSAMSWHARACN